MGDPSATPPAAPAAPVPGSVTLYDKGGAPVVVDAADAPGHILSGTLGYAAGTRVPVRINGEIGTVDADALSNAVAKSGATPVSSKDFADQQLQTKYGSTTQAAEAFGLSALDSATLGTSNALIGGIGGKEARASMRGIEAANPSASTAGNVAGFVVPIAADVLSGGTLTPELLAAEGARAGERGLARGALAVRAPTKLVSGVGELAEGAARAVVGRNAETSAGRLAQNILAGGVRGAAEGGIYGVGQEVGHQYLQDNPELSGEALGSAWWHGAVLGGSLGGGLGGIGGMLSKKAPALAQAEERSLFEGGEKAEGKIANVAKTESTVADKAADTIIAQVDDPKKAKLLADAWKRRSFEGHDKLIGDATTKVTEDLDEAIKAGRVVDMSSFGEAKSNQMRKLVPVENLKPARDMAMQVWGDARKVVDGLGELPLNTGERASVKRLGMWLDDFGDMSNKGKWSDPAELFDKIDDFKRRVGKEAGFGKFAQGREESTNQFNALYERIRTGLEDESTWGAAAVAQKEINLATANMIDTNGKFLQRFTTQYGKESLTGAPTFIADSAKVNGFVNGLTSAANDTNARMASDYVLKRSAFLDSVTKNYDLAADALAAVKKERAALGSMAETIAKTSNEISNVNQLKSLLADERGHSIHGIVGLAIDAVTKPGLTLARLAELEATKNRAVAKIDSGIGSIKKALGGTGERKPSPAPSLPDSPSTYEKRRSAVLSAASKPDELHAHIQGQAAPISPSAPATAQAFQRAGLRTVQYLMGELPKPPPRAGSLTPQLDAENWQASDQQKAQFNRKFDAATHPDHMLHLVADGTITAQHVQALQATRPATYEHMSQKLDTELKAQTKPVPLHMQGPIKTFLGIPQMDPELQRLIHANYVPPNTNKPGLKRPMKIADTTSLHAMKERL